MKYLISKIIIKNYSNKKGNQKGDSIMKFREGDELTGSGILESLTSGLYTDNSNCIREYVQNALDAFTGIEDETRLKIEISFMA